MPSNLKLAEWRAAFGMTQQHLANLSGLPRSTISRVERTGVASNTTVNILVSVFRGLKPLHLSLSPTPELVRLVARPYHVGVPTEPREPDPSNPTAP